MPRPDLDSSSKPEPQLAADPQRLENLRQLQWESLARHANQLPVLVPTAACFVGFIVWDSVAPQLVLGWIAAITAVLLARWGFSRNYKRFVSRVGSALNVMVALSACNGVIQGGGLLLFFPGLDLVQKAIVTMIMVCLASGAVSANAAYSRSFYAWAIPMFAALAAAWTLGGDPDAVWIALLLVLFPVTQTLFVHGNEKVLRESFDIRYEHNEALRQLKEANTAKSRFLAAASHDLRQPLHTLSLYSAALGARKTDERTQGIAQEIGTAIQALGTLLDALLDISKLDSGAVQPQPQRFALHALLERLAAAFQPLAAAKGLEFETEVHPVVVETDPLLVERIVRNLMDNAIKYTAHGKVRMALAAEGERAVLTISDTGPGIPRSEHERVFEEFQQLANPERDRSKGIGLGLAIVRRLERLLRLELKLESDSGCGATFRLWLPLAKQPDLQEDAKPAAALPAVPLAAGTRVLVLDDDGLIRRGTQTLLEEWGFEVTLTSSLDEAIAAMGARAPELVIADYQLSGGDTGAELIQLARALSPGVAALLVTGNTTKELLREAEELGVALLRKPVAEGELRRAIADAVGSGGAPYEGRERGENGMAVGGLRKASG